MNGRTIAWRPSPLPSQAADLELYSQRLESDAYFLQNEAAKLLKMAGDRETKAMGLGKQYKELRADATRLEQQALEALKAADTDCQAASNKWTEVQELQRSMVQLQVQAREYAQQADAKAAAAELQLKEASFATTRAQQVGSAVVETERESKVLKSRARQLLAAANQPAREAEAFMERALEKATQAVEVKADAVAAQRPVSPQALHAVGLPADAPGPPHMSRGAGEHEGPRGAMPAEHATEQRMEHLRAQLAARELHAAQLEEQARLHSEHSHMLERAAERRVVQVQRVLYDAKLAKEQEAEALRRAQAAGDEALVSTGKRMAETWARWAGLEPETPHWKSAAG